MADQAVLVCEFASLGEAYVFANSLPKEIELLEVFGSGLVICRGTESNFAVVRFNFASSKRITGLAPVDDQASHSSHANGQEEYFIIPEEFSKKFFPRFILSLRREFKNQY